MATFRGLAEKHLEGGKELDAKLRELGAAGAAKVLRLSLRDALRPVHALYVGRMRVGTRMHRTYKGRRVAPGFSQRNTYISTRVRKGTSVTASIGPKDEAFYQLWFLETVGFSGGRGKRRLGSVLTLKRRARRKWNRPTRTAARIPPRPVLAPIFRAARNSMLSSFVTSTRARLQAVARKGGRR